MLINRKNLFIFIIGLVLGVVIGILAALALNSAFSFADSTVHAQSSLDYDSSAVGSAQSSLDYAEWRKDAVYNGGETVLYNNKLYKAKWWTQGEQPGNFDVWEDTLQTPSAEKIKETSSSLINEKIINKSDIAQGFKVVGYYPAWDTKAINKANFNILTHVIYAFAIPTAEGGLRPLDNPENALQLIKAAHEGNAKALIAIGGWSYNDVPLEPVFAAATETEEKLESFAQSIISLCDEYGFDGVDIDWEHPRVDGATSAQYEALMLLLSERLHAKDKLLTSAVISGATADNNIYYDAAAHTQKVINAVDWLNIMAYDGGEAERHSSYEFAESCVDYWAKTRGASKEKVVLGVPFYARPSWASYEDILSADPEAYSRDFSVYNSTTVFYNGIDTIKRKTAFALENGGGIMIWELSQDTSQADKSLLSAIGEQLSE